MLQLDSVQMSEWAGRQLADYDAKRPGTMFGEGVELDVEQAYRIQAAVAQLRSERGERIIGYKVGCTSSTIRAQLGIDHSISGRLFDSEHHRSGVTLSRNNFANPAIEGELAVELSREPRVDDFPPNEIPACVKRVFPVMELHNHVIRSEKPSAGELIANNAIHAGFCAGDGIAWNAENDDENEDGPTLAIDIDDQQVETCSGPQLIRTINDSLQWLSRQLRDHGEQLRPGQIVLTGSLPPLIPIAGNCVVRVDAGRFGFVAAGFED